VGESIEDLRAFDPQDFARALITGAASADEDEER